MNLGLEKFPEEFCLFFNSEFLVWIEWFEGFDSYAGLVCHFVFFPCSCCYAIYEQYWRISFELPEDSGPVGLRGEEFSWMVEHDVCVPAWDQTDRVNGVNGLYLSDVTA